MWVFFYFLYYKQWRGGACIWPVIFLLQPVIWSPLSAWWHDVSAVSCTCHNKSVSLQGLTTPKRGTPFGYTSKYGVFEKKFHLCVITIPWKWIFWSIRIHHTKGQIFVNLFQWHDGQHFCETDKEGIFTCEWSYCVLHVCWDSFDIFIESGLFRLGGAQISGGKKYEARTLPFKVYLVKLLAEHCGKGKRWVYVAWYVHATLWKIPMVGWDLLGAFLAYLDSTIHPDCMQIFVSM